MFKGFHKGVKSSEMRMASAGIELAGVILVMALAGYGLDYYFETSPWWTIIMTMLGVIGGTYNIAKEGMKQFKDEDGSGPTQSK